MRHRSTNPLKLTLALLPATLAVMLLIAACQPRTVDEDFVVADLFVTQGKALATIELSPTPPPATGLPNQPNVTPNPTLPLPTVVVLQQPTLPIGTPGAAPTRSAAPPTPLSCAGPPPMPFTPIWQNIEQARALMGCPVGDPQEVRGAFQFFEHGAMFWRESDHSIFVISELGIRQGQETDSWWRVDDTFQEGEPESDPALVPPDGLIQPIRGFGKVWRNNAFIREALGWATTPEAQATSLWQMFDGGWMMTGPNGSPIYVMAPLDDPPYSSGIHLGPLP
ncbi:MAG TPA: hypothetical protein ENI95_00475 [Chloroflexi bacterium]|nr:hypothetical protein [Chloroflexota bacterium]